MSLRIKLILSFLVILLLVVSLLSLNSIMAGRETKQMKELLWIHHKYTTLLNLKIAVNRQQSEAQEIFIYGKNVDGETFRETTNLVKNEVAELVKADSFLNDFLSQEEKTIATLNERQKRLVDIQHRYEDINRELVLLSRLIKVGRQTKAQDHFKREIGKRFAGFFEAIDDWIAYEEKELKEVEEGFVVLSSKHNLASIIGLSAILIIILLFFLTFVYLLGPRLKELFQGTTRIAEGDFSKPVNETGKDEFANFAKAMNQMMASLAESRKKLLEQSYYSGMADMVSGVLHNVKNALAPILIDMEYMEDRVGQIKSGKLAKAAKGIVDLSLPEDRRQDLLEYVELSCAKIDAHANEFQQSLELMKTKVRLVDKVLGEHNSFSAAERPLENIKVEELVQDSLGLVRKDYLDKIQLVVEPCIAEIGQIRTQRIVVIQILANLVMNALESIIRSEKSDGRVVISAKQNNIGTAAKLHLTVTDNGAGISQEKLSLIFQRGVSNKQGSFGLGLHWCANAAASLDGQLFAESEGEGKGACLNLVL